MGLHASGTSVNTFQQHTGGVCGRLEDASWVCLVDAAVGCSPWFRESEDGPLSARHRNSDAESVFDRVCGGGRFQRKELPSAPVHPSTHPFFLRTTSPTFFSSIRVSVSLCICLCLGLSVFFISLYLSLSLYLFMSLAVCLSVCLCLCLYLSLSLFIYLSFFIYLFLCLPVSLSVCLSLSLSVSVCQSLSDF